MDRAASNRYRHDIDGLRAIAVAAVVIFHFSQTLLARGFLGVDIFFVISGYLIAGLVLRGLGENRFSIAVFYQRRIGRLIPALIALLLATSMAVTAIFLPADLEGYAKSLLASLFFVANIYFWRDTDYFSGSADQKPLLHLWSLGVEEQFYIFFPFLFLLLARHPRTLVPALGLLTGGSFAMNVWMLQIDGASPAFYLLPTRIWEFGIGALVALHCGADEFRHRHGRALRAFATILVTGGLFYGGMWPPSLPVAAPVVIGTALIIWVGAPQTSLTGRMLALAPVNFLGRISYSLYLWHWPLIVLTKYYLIRELTLAESCIVGLLALLVSMLSWKYVEEPFRARGAPFPNLAVRLIAGSAGVTAIAILLICTHGLPTRLSPEVASINRSVGTNYRCPVSRMVPFGASRACQLTLGNKGTDAADLILLGDSHAQMYAPIIADILDEQRKTGILVAINSCLPTVSFNISEECRRAAEVNLQAVRAIPSARTIIVAFNWQLYLNHIDRTERSGTDKGPKIVLEAVRDLARRLPGRRIFVVGMIEQPGFEVASVLSRQMAFGTRPLAPDSSPAASFQARFASILSGFDDVGGPTLIRPDLQQCDESKCYFVRDGIALFSDSNHVAVPALLTFKPAFADVLGANAGAMAAP